MDSAFQELDYSDISAKNITKKPEPGIIDTKSRGGLLRLIILIIVTSILATLSIKIFSRYSELKKLEKELLMLKSPEGDPEVSSEASKELNSIRKENSELTEKISKAKEIYDTIVKENKKIEEENANISEELSKFQENMKKLDTEYNNLNAENQKLNNQISSLEKENEDLQNKINGLN